MQLADGRSHIVTLLERRLTCNHLRRLLLAVEKQRGKSEPSFVRSIGVIELWNVLQGSIPEVDSNMERAINLLPPGAKASDVALSGKQRPLPAQSMNLIATRITGKLKALDDLLDVIYTRTDEKVVLVSSYTATLDVLAALCKLRRYNNLRLDGNVAQKNRQVCLMSSGGVDDVLINRVIFTGSRRLLQ